jgi:hypothetical protein
VADRIASDSSVSESVTGSGGEISFVCLSIFTKYRSRGIGGPSIFSKAAHLENVYEYVN